MEFIVTHLTRMEYPNVCVAGVDAHTHKSVRLVVPYPQTFTCSMLSHKGGPFELGARLDVGETEARPQPPETEDRMIVLRKVKKLGCVSKDALWKLVSDNVQEKIRAIFGQSLERTHQTYSSEEGKGTVSLGFLRPEKIVRLLLREFEGRTKIALLCQDEGERLQLPITDIRLHTHFSEYPVDRSAVLHMNLQLDLAADVVLSVGLTRAWSGRHWLQVNNIHFPPESSQ